MDPMAYLGPKFLNTMLDTGTVPMQYHYVKLSTFFQANICKRSTDYTEFYNMGHWTCMGPQNKIFGTSQQGPPHKEHYVQVFITIP